MKFLTVSKVVVVNAEGNLLLLRRSASDDRRPNEWDIPGGHVDIGEFSNEAAVRETEEEAGININPKYLKLLYAMTEMPKEDTSVTWVFYSAEIDSADVRLSDEHDEYKWVTFAEALDFITYERQQRAIKYIDDNDLLHASAC